MNGFNLICDPAVLSNKHVLPSARDLVFCLCQITMEAMKSDIDEVALQGIEFWSNVCDEEVDLAIEFSEVWYHV